MSLDFNLKTFKLRGILFFVILSLLMRLTPVAADYIDGVYYEVKDAKGMQLNKCTYTGQYIIKDDDRLPHGIGAMISPDGDGTKTYTGKWENGRIVGEGTMIYHDRRVKQFVGGLEVQTLTTKAGKTYRIIIFGATATHYKAYRIDDPNKIEIRIPRPTNTVPSRTANAA